MSRLVIKYQKFLGHYKNSLLDSQLLDVISICFPAEKFLVSININQQNKEYYMEIPHLQVYVFATCNGFISEIRSSTSQLYVTVLYKLR